MIADHSDRCGKSRWFRLAALVCLFWAGAVHGSTLFALVDTGELFVSTDQAETWAIRASLPVRDAVAIGAGGSLSELYLASASGTVYRSIDAGFEWSGVGTVSAGDVTDMVVLPDLSVLLLTAAGTVYRSNDLGSSFAALSTLTGSDFTDLALMEDGFNLYALTRTGESYESADGGTSWAATGTLAVSDAVELRVSTTAMFILTSTGDVYRSTDGASNWMALGTLSQVGMTSLVIDHGEFVAAAGTGEVTTSADGVSWTWRSAINQMTVRSLGSDTPPASGIPPDGTEGGIAVSPPWPNPVRRGQEVSVRLSLPGDTRVTVGLYDVTGRSVDGSQEDVYIGGDRRLECRPVVGNAGLYILRIGTASGKHGDRRLVVLP